MNVGKCSVYLSQKAYDILSPEFMYISGGVCLLRNSETQFKVNSLCVQEGYVTLTQFYLQGNYILGKKITVNFTLEQATPWGGGSDMAVLFI